jgi:hypothetical protein
MAHDLLQYLSPVMTALLIYVTARINVQRKKDTDEVRSTLKENTKQTTGQIADLAIVTKDTHTLVNSQMGQQLMTYAITARTLANLTQKPEHIQAADEADAKLAEHQRKQAVVDSK